MYNFYYKIKYKTRLLTLANWLDPAVLATFKSIPFEYHTAQANAAAFHCAWLLVLVGAALDSGAWLTHFAVFIATEPIVNVIGWIVLIKYGLIAGLVQF